MTKNPVNTLAGAAPGLARLLNGRVLGIAEARGAQIYLSHGLDVIFDGAVGETVAGRAMTGHEMHNLLCGTKPAVALAVMAIAEAHGVGFHDPLGLWFSDAPVLGDIEFTLSDVLRHSCGLRAPGIFEATFMSPELREESFLRACQLGRRDDAVYSQYVGWKLLGRLVEVLTARPAGLEVRRVLHDVSHGEIVFDMSEHELATGRQRFGYYHVRSSSGTFPLLHDRDPQFACYDRIALGGFATMRAMGRVMETALDALTGRRDAREICSSETLRRVLNSERTWLEEDTAFGRDVSCAGGFFLNDGYGAFGPDFPEDTVGHFGWMGTSTMLAVPSENFVMAIMLNGVPNGSAEVHEFRRQLGAAVASDFFSPQPHR